MSDQLALWPRRGTWADGKHTWCVDDVHFCELEVTPIAPGCGRRFALGRGRTAEDAEAQAREIASWPETAT